MSRPSSLTMCTSTDDCFCHEQVRQSLSPNSSKPQRSRSSADMDSKSSSGSGGAVATEEHLLERVAAQPEPQRLERDHLVGRDVAEVDVRAELLHEPGLRLLRRRLEEEVGDRDLVDDLVDEAGAHLTGRTVDPSGAAFAALGDHLPRAGGQLFLDPLDPLVRRVDDVRVLGADLGKDDEVLRELRDQLELPLARDLERSVRDLHVREALLAEPLLELVEPAAPVDRLEQRSAADDRGLERAIERDLLLEVVGDVRRPPTELDDVDELTGGVEHAFDVAQVQALVDDVGQAFGARLAGALGQVKKTVVKGGHRAPSASPGLRTERRG